MKGPIQLMLAGGEGTIICVLSCAILQSKSVSQNATWFPGRLIPIWAIDDHSFMSHEATPWPVVESIDEFSLSLYKKLIDLKRIV